MVVPLSLALFRVAPRGHSTAYAAPTRTMTPDRRRDMDPIYLDHNATAPLLPAVWEAMRPHLTGALGNPASAHHAGRRARRALEDARERLAHLLRAHPDEVVFTSGATEANNLALLGLADEPPG